jgi:hypothetical protein
MTTPDSEDDGKVMDHESQSDTITCKETWNFKNIVGLAYTHAHGYTITKTPIL